MRGNGAQRQLKRRMWTFRTRPTAANEAMGGRTAVAHERQRDAGDRHDAHGHPDVLEDLEDQHGEHPDAHERAQRSLARAAARKCATRPARRGEEHGRADEAELLADSGEDEVGVLLGHV